MSSATQQHARGTAPPSAGAAPAGSRAPPPTFSNALDTSRFKHPWIKPLPAGRARTYDLLYKATSSLLLGFACYGLFETMRGAYYIHTGNQRAIDERAAAEAKANAQ